MDIFHASKETARHDQLARKVSPPETGAGVGVGESDMAAAGVAVGKPFASMTSKEKGRVCISGRRVGGRRSAGVSGSAGILSPHHCFEREDRQPTHFYI